VFIRNLLDLAIMIGIGILLALSLWVQAGINDAVKPVLLRLAPENVTVGWQDAIDAIARGVGIFLGLMVNVVLAASLLSGVTRLRMPLRRLIPSTLLVAIGLSALSTVGRLYIDYTAHRPAFQLVGGTVAVLLFLYLFNQLVLYGAALAATSAHGVVVDLAAGPSAGATAESDGTQGGGAVVDAGSQSPAPGEPAASAGSAGEPADRADRSGASAPDGGVQGKSAEADGGRRDSTEADRRGTLRGGRDASDRP
jgi:membrane protein